VQVVADTGPLNYLVQIDAIRVLPKLFDRIIVPTSVHEEAIGAPRLLCAPGPSESRLGLRSAQMTVETGMIPCGVPWTKANAP